MSNVTKQQIDKIVKYLETVKTHPQMYMAEGIPSIFSFLDGFRVACASFGIELLDQQYRGIFCEVNEQRGWEYLAEPLWEQMKNSGLSNEEITQEMLAVYIEVWRRVGDTVSQE